MTSFYPISYPQSRDAIAPNICLFFFSRTREIAKIILSHSGNIGELESPYENHSHAESPDSPVIPRARAPSWNVREPRGARSVEELDKRVSSFSTTSGCSDCTTSTLQASFLMKKKTHDFSYC